MVEGVVCGAVGAGCWGLWRGCWAGVSGVPWGWVLGAAEGAIGGVVGVPQGEGAGGRGGGVWWGGTGRRGGGCWGLRWARWRRSAGAVGVGAGGRGEGGGGGQRGAVGVGAGSRGEAGRVRQTASINTPGPPPRVTLKFDRGPWKIIKHLFYTTSSLVHHFIAICEFKMELQSGNAQFWSKLAIFGPTWPWNLTDDLEKQ